MKVLMFSADSSILESGSAAQKRMIDYGTLAEQLFIVVLFKKKVKKRISDISPNTRVYSAWFFNAWRLGSMFKGEGIDLVTAQDPFETGLAGYLVARSLRAKLQLQIHTDFLSPYFAKESVKNYVRVRLAKWLLPKADSVRVVSERIKRSLTTYNLQLTTIDVLPIFVDVAEIQSAPITVNLRQKYPQFDFIALMASRLTKEKNINMAIKGMSAVVKQRPRAGLIIVGDGPEKKNLFTLRSLGEGGQLTTYQPKADQPLAGNYHLSTNVIFEPWTEDLPSYYKTADVFLNTSNYEGYGRTLIEAAAAGCPVITTDVGTVGEALNKNNCLVVSAGNSEALSASILKLVRDNSLRQELGQKAKAAVQNLGSKESSLQKHKKSWSNAL